MSVMSRLNPQLEIDREKGEREREIALYYLVCLDGHSILCTGDAG